MPFINYNSLLFRLLYQILSHLEFCSSVIDCLFFPHYTLDWDCGGVIVLGVVMATELFGGVCLMVIRLLWSSRRLFGV